jgi:hypothetical protein
VELICLHCPDDLKTAIAALLADMVEQAHKSNAFNFGSLQSNLIMSQHEVHHQCAPALRIP